MRLTVFGATGRTGKLLVGRALAVGHQVKVLARNPSKLAIKVPELEVIPGEVRNPEHVGLAVQGARAVISVLGPTRNEQTYEVSAGMAHILEAMRKEGVRRLVLTAGAGVRAPQDAPGLSHHAITWLLRLLSRHIFEEMMRVVTLVRASELDWTVVRVPMLTNGPATGAVQVGYVGGEMGRRLSRADLAEFLLHQVGDTRFLRQAPVISQK